MFFQGKNDSTRTEGVVIKNIITEICLQLDIFPSMILQHIVPLGEGCLSVSGFKSNRWTWEYVKEIDVNRIKRSGMER